jgi:hypothetical protein
MPYKHHEKIRDKIDKPRHKLSQELAPGLIVIVDSTGLKVRTNGIRKNMTLQHGALGVNCTLQSMKTIKSSPAN